MSKTEMCLLAIALSLAWWIAWVGYHYATTGFPRLLSILGALSVTFGSAYVTYRRSRP